MFFAARTFAMKFGQSLAMILFTSLAVAMPDPSSTGDEVFPGKAGMILVAAAAVLFCVAGAIILLFYGEKKVMKTIAKEGDEAFMKAIESEKDLGEEKEEK
jgi:GPH family glycoside/pentoside/hexuronide:cation symporter